MATQGAEHESFHVSYILESIFYFLLLLLCYSLSLTLWPSACQCEEFISACSLRGHCERRHVDRSVRRLVTLHLQSGSWEMAGAQLLPSFFLHSRIPAHRMVPPTSLVGLSLNSLETPALTYAGVCSHGVSKPIEFSKLTITVRNM